MIFLYLTMTDNILGGPRTLVIEVDINVIYFDNLKPY